MRVKSNGYIKPARDADHPCPHWHTGTAKLDDEGNVQRFSNGAWRYRNEGNAFLHRFN